MQGRSQARASVPSNARASSHFALLSESATVRSNKGGSCYPVSTSRQPEPGEQKFVSPGVFHMTCSIHGRQ